MSYSISTLMLRNLSDVFAEIDPVRRRKAIEEIWHEDGVFYDPNSGPHRGRDEIERIAGKVKATHPDFRYQPISAPEEIGDAGRVRWVARVRRNRFPCRPRRQDSRHLYVFRQASLSFFAAFRAARRVPESPGVLQARLGHRSGLRRMRDS